MNLANIVNNLRVPDLPIEKRIEAYVIGNVELEKFVKEKIDPLIDNIIRLEAGKGIKNAEIIETFYRMYMWIQTLSVLKSYNHFQAACSAARSLFELLIDLKILAFDETGDFKKRFNAFPYSETLRVLKKIREFCKKHPDDVQLGFSANDAAQIDNVDEKQILNMREETWKNKNGKPFTPKNHWTGIQDLKRRVELVGKQYKTQKYEALYFQTYSIFSWYIHPGSTGYRTPDKEILKYIFGLAHHFARIIFIEAVLIFGKETKIGEAVDNYYKKLIDIKSLPEKILDKELHRIVMEKMKTK